MLHSVLHRVAKSDFSVLYTVFLFYAKYSENAVFMRNVEKSMFVHLLYKRVQVLSSAGGEKVLGFQGLFSYGLTAL